MRASQPEYGSSLLFVTVQSPSLAKGGEGDSGPSARAQSPRSPFSKEGR